MVRFLRWLVALLVAAHGLVHLTIFPGAAAYGGGRLEWDGRSWLDVGTPTLGIGRGLVLVTVAAHLLAAAAMLRRRWWPAASRLMVAACLASALTFIWVWEGLRPTPGQFWRGPLVTLGLAALVPVVDAAFRDARSFMRTRFSQSVFGTWGSTAAERELISPAERHLPAAPYVSWRGVDVDAPAELTAAWVSQMRVAPYSYDLLDNKGHRSPRTRDLGAAPVAVGDPIMGIFEVVEVQAAPEWSFTAFSTNQPPTALTYAVRATGKRTCRICVTVAATTASMLGAVTLAVCDAIMMRKQLLTFAAYAEREAHEAVTPSR